MKLGDKMRFVPSAFTCFNDGSPIQAHCGSTVKKLREFYSGT